MAESLRAMEIKFNPGQRSKANSGVGVIVGVRVGVPVGVRVSVGVGVTVGVKVGPGVRVKALELFRKSISVRLLWE